MSEYAGQFNPLAGFSGFDYLTAGTQPSEKGVAPAQRNTLRLWQNPGDPTWLGRGEITLYDFSLQGFNHPEGDFSQNSNGYVLSQLVTLRPNELTPPPNHIELDDASIGGNKVGFHTCAAFSTVFMGVGSVADHALFKETSATDATPVAITYTPAAEICSLSRTLASGAERLAAGHVGQPVKFFSDAAGTVSATGHSSTNSCWGIIMSGVNADPTKAGTPQLLLYCGTTIGYISADVAMSTAVTTSHTGVNAGGFAIGAIKAGGRAQMAYWAIPKVSNTSGALKFGAEAYCDIFATPMDGSDDMLPVEFKYLPHGILGAIHFRNGILAHDGQRVCYWDGDTEYNLGLFRKRVISGVPNTITHDDTRRIRALIDNEPECGVIWQSYDANAALNGAAHCEMYNFESGSWHNADFPFDMTTTSAALEVVLGNGSAISPTGRRFWYLDSATTESIQGCYIPPPGESLLWQHSLGTGTVTANVPTFYEGGPALLGPRWRLDAVPPGSLPGTKSIARNNKVIYEVEFNGNLDYGGSGIWSLNVIVRGYGADGTTQMIAYNQTFSQGQNSEHYVRKNPGTAWTNIQDVQVFLNATATGTTRKVPMLLPIVVRFAYSKDGRDITPENAPSLLSDVMYD